MGIKDLWSILTPFCERKPLYELQGKRVAIDLSCWICEAQNVSDYSVQPRMYLRNLYFRTCYLLLMDVEPVFVLEGKAPELKFDTIAARNAIQFKGARPKKDGVKTGKDRTRFHFVLRQCEEMLNSMGLACIKGSGEAESLCAYLNEDGLVHGCISQDSDCFAYGAKVVYRNFSISQQGAHSASGGSVDVYDITKAYESLRFGRNKIIALALLCGSDYCDGVFGIGKDSALKLFEKVPDEEILDRLRSWRHNKSLYEEFEQQLSDKNICTSCGHPGKLQSHSKVGCKTCKTTKGCDFSKFKNERLAIKNELNIRSKALQNPDFPNEDLIKEYSIKKDNVQILDLKWKQPNMVNFVKFTTKHLQWEEIYAFEKFLPILTRWQLFNFETITNKLKTSPNEIKGVLFPDRIKKIRNPKGVPSYEIIWNDKEEYFKGLIPEEQLLQVAELDKLWSTIEPQNLVTKAYPDLVASFLESKSKPKKATKRQTKKKDNNVDEISDMLKNTSISEPKPKRTRQPKNQKKNVKVDNDVRDLEESFSKLKVKEKKSKTIDSYFKKAVQNSHALGQKREDGLGSTEDKHDDYEDSIILLDHQNLLSSTPTKLVSCQRKSRNEVSMSPCKDSSDLDDINDGDLTDIVENILRKKRFSIIDRNLEDLGLKMCDSDKPDNRSSFFISVPVEDDLFEQTFNNEHFENGYSQDSTQDEDYKENSFEIEDCKDCDSFEVDRLPLLERIKLRIC